MTRAKLWLIRIATVFFAVLNIQCGQAPTGSSGRLPVDPGASLAAADSQAWAAVLPAFQLHRDAYLRIRLAGLRAQAVEKDYRQDFRLRGWGAPPAAIPPSAGRRSALGDPRLRAMPTAHGSLRLAPDTSWFRYEDSSRGFIQWIHAYGFADATGSGEARDSLVYRWPYVPSGPAVLRHFRLLAYADGANSRLEVADADGDGILNQALVGRVVELRRDWTTVAGDTAWKSSALTRHGASTYYDSLGAGAPLGWTDTVLLAGRAVWWQKTRDADGDGLVLAHAPGAAQKIAKDLFQDNGDGTFRFDYEMRGPGPDGDYLQSGDNESYPSQGAMVGSRGEDLVLTVRGDADGDGFYWRQGAANRAFITRRFAARRFADRDGILAWRDSLVEITGGSGPGRVAFYAAELEYADGSAASVWTQLPKGADFGGSDTVQVRELRRYAAGRAGDSAADLDSTLRVLWVVPGDLADAGDDRLARRYAQDWYKAGNPSLSVSELLTPAIAFPVREAPTAGSYVREEIFVPVSARSVVRVAQWREFDGVKKQSAWKEIRYLENGDSAVSEGAGTPLGAGRYAQNLGREVRQAGWYDAASGEFRDTVVHLDARGSAAVTEVTWGTLDALKGTGTYQTNRAPAAKPASTAEYAVSSAAAALRLTRRSGGDTAQVDIHGDSASHTLVAGRVRRKLEWSPGNAETFRVRQTDQDDRDGAVLATAEYLFARDGLGSGMLVRSPGASPVESHILFHGDGSVFVDGVRVNR